MASYLQIEKLSKSYGERLLFHDVTFGVDEGQKIGIVARNGSGKSTLLNVIAGHESPDSGSVVFRADLRVGYLDQTPHFEPGVTVLQACIGSSAASATASIIEAYEKALASGDADAIAAASEQMDSAGAWDYEDRLRQLLTQLNITNPEAKVETLSGGQLKRVALARVILENPDLLLLDEPTNHLDIDVIEWLENYLAHSRVTLLLVTHDRYFLDRVCNSILEIDRQQVYSYKGNYDYYLRRRAERIEAMEAELDRVRNTLRKETEWMRRQPQARAGKAKYRIDAFHELTRRSKIDLRERNADLSGMNSGYIGSKIFEAEGINKAYGDKVILRDFTYTFARGEKVGIIGPNGVGKSTFIKMLLSEVAQDSGQWNVGTTVRFGYYSQQGIKFDSTKKVIDAVTDMMEEVTLADGVTRYSPMQFLNRFLFSPADQQKYIHTLSGGEKARLHLATVLMTAPNFLILDEPTNDLDIMTLGLLEEYLAEFKGCVIVVSHDRFFLDSIVDHIFVFEGNGVVKDFPGNYTDYRQALAEKKRLEAVEAAPADKPRHQEKTALRKEKMSFKEKQEFNRLTEDIDRLTAEKNDIDKKFSSGEVIDDVAALSARYSEITSQLDEMEMRWLELSEKE